MEITEKEQFKEILLKVIASHKKTTIQNGISIVDDKENFQNVLNTVACFGSNYCKNEGKKFVIDENNHLIIKFLTYYFFNSKKCEEIFPDKNYKLHKNICLVGNPGTGKTLLMKIFSDLTKKMNEKLKFENISLSELINYQKVNGNLDLYQYNIGGKSLAGNGNPISICLNDFGLDIENQKDYGNDFKILLNDFLFARYELYQNLMIRFHLTSNMSEIEFKDRLSPQLRDRMKSFNIIFLNGESRRNDTILMIH